MTDKKNMEDNTPLAGLSIDNSIDEVYANGFSVSYGNSDVILSLQRNGRIIQHINMSYTLAKTLSQIMGNIVTRIETDGEFEIRTTTELDKKLIKETVQ